LYSAGSDVEIYTSLVANDNGVNFTRQALPVYGCDKNIIPVGVDYEKGGEVTFSASVVPLGGYRFYLEDRKTGSFTNLATGTYKVTLPEKTSGTGRFYIHASESVLTGINDHTGDPNQLNLRIWASQMKVMIDGPVTGNATAAVYDMQGRRIVDTNLTDGNYNTITMPADVKGIYVVIVTDGAKVTRKKVVIM
jgi:hypothetical protein